MEQVRLELSISNHHDLVLMRYLNELSANMMDYTITLHLSDFCAKVMLR